MPLTIVDGPTIPHNESLSDGADCSGGDIVRITVPQEFTPANLTFQSSSDGNMYNDLYDAEGEEILRTIIVAAEWAKTLGWIKIRSGTRAAPVAQSRDACKFGIALDTAAP